MQVVKAVAKQLGTLNTNARYLHDNLVAHAELIAQTMPDPLEVTSSSESGASRALGRVSFVFELVFVPGLSFLWLEGPLSALMCLE